MCLLITIIVYLQSEGGGLDNDIHYNKRRDGRTQYDTVHNTILAER